MKKCVLFVLFCTFFASSQTTINVTEPSDITTLIDNRFQQYQTYTASFKELTPFSLRRGTIKFKKPNRLQVKYFNRDQTTHMEIYSTASKLHVYMKPINLVCEQELSPSVEQDEIFASKIVNLHRLLESYNFNFTESKNLVPLLSDEELRQFRIPIKKDIFAFHMKLEPKDVTEGLSQMELWVSEDGMIKRCKSVNIEGKTIEYLFSNIETDIQIADSEFDFEIPANAQVLKNSLIDFEETKSQETSIQEKG